LALLQLERVSRRFGGVRAVTAFELDVQAGDRLGLIGPNGSGKTTVLNLSSGIYPPDEGAIWLEGERIDGKPAHCFARRGIARTFQNLRIAGRLSVTENVAVAVHARTASGSDEAKRRSRAHDETASLLDALDLSAARDDPASTLPLPQLRRLELARALCRSPRVLLLDEPTGGMTPAETGEMARLIARLVPARTALLLVEHKLDVVASLCSRIAVLDAGRKIVEGPPNEIFRDPEVMRIYLP
jgi:ABC-type branched-subunit amino acid transport system ATPase component